MGQTLHAVRAEEPVRAELARLGAREAGESAADYVLVAAPGTSTAAAADLWRRRDDADVLVASDRSRLGLRARWIRRWLELPCHDVASGLRLYRASALRRSAARPERPLDALVRLHRAGFRVVEVPAPGRPEDPDGWTGPWELVRLRRLRRAARAADEDERAYRRRTRFGRRVAERRHEQVVRFLEVDVPLLDVGCGTGRLIQSAPRSVGVDIDVAKLRYLRARAPAVVAGAAETLPFRDASFPQIVCTGVLDRLAEAESAIGELKRVLRPGGTLVVGAPARRVRGLREALEREGFSIDGTRSASRAEVVLRAVRRMPRRAGTADGSTRSRG